jgi:hypothetical protein
MGKSFAVLLVILLLSVTGLGSVCVLPVKAQGNITITVDGSVSPLSGTNCSIWQQL